MKFLHLLCATLACALLFGASTGLYAYSIMTDENVFRHHDNDCMKIAITFDDGPSPLYTPAILDYLKEEKVTATFFLVGSQVRMAPSLVQREAQEGHELGNHTDEHPHLSRLSIDALRREVLMCEQQIYELTETRTLLFRPPEGHCSQQISDMLAGLDYRIILWNIDTRDWDHTTAAEIAENVLSTVKSGDIILFHDCVSRKDSQTLDALKLIIPELKQRGFQFVTVSELIDTGIAVSE